MGGFSGVNTQNKWLEEYSESSEVNQNEWLEKYSQEIKNLKNYVFWTNKELDKKNHELLNGICTSVLQDLEGTWDKDIDIREKRNIKIYVTWRDSFEIESYWMKTVFDWNYLYDIIDWSRSEIMKIDKDIYNAESWYFENNNESKKVIEGVIRTMNLINMLKSEDLFRDIVFDEKEWWIYARWMFWILNDSILVKTETIKSLADSIWMEAYVYASYICRHLNRVK